MFTMQTLFYLFRSGLRKGQVSTIWESTCGDGAKKQPTSAQMGEGYLVVLLLASTQMGEAAADKQQQTP